MFRPRRDSAPTITNSPPRHARWARRLLVAVVAAATLVGIAAPPASASVAEPAHSSYTWTSYNGGYSNVRYCASDDVCGIKAQLPNYTTVYMLCWVDDDWAFGNSWSNRWFLVRYWTNQVGYIHATLVYNQASSPNCLA